MDVRETIERLIDSAIGVGICITVLGMGLPFAIIVWGHLLRNWHGICG